MKYGFAVMIVDGASTTFAAPLIMRTLPLALLPLRSKRFQPTSPRKPRGDSGTPMLTIPLTL